MVGDLWNGHTTLAFAGQALRAGEQSGSLVCFLLSRNDERNDLSSVSMQNVNKERKVADH